jgi:hypothetical protein
MPWGEGTTAALREDISQSRTAEWEVAFHDFATIGIDPSRGVVTSAVDYSAVAEHEAAKEPPVLDEQAAVACGTEIIRLAGLEGAATLEAPTVALQECSPGVYRYTICWRMMHQGIPYDIGGVQVMLSAADGRLLVLSSGLDVPAPPRVSVATTETSAAAAAVDYALRAGSPFEPAEVDTELRIVLPNAYWSHWGLGPEALDAGSRAAWVTMVRDDRGRVRVFWIDAETGTLLGGSQSLDALPAAAAASGPAPAAALHAHAGARTARPQARFLLIAVPVLAALGVTVGLLRRVRRATG